MSGKRRSGSSRLKKRYASFWKAFAVRDPQGTSGTANRSLGRKVEKGSDIAIGTAIAIFVDRKYPQAGNSGKRAVIHLGQNFLGTRVLDQWKAQGEARVRAIR